MEIDSVVYSTIGVISTIGCIYVVYALLNWVWFTPKRHEKCLREQGYKGNSYKLLVGDMLDLSKTTKEFTSTPIPLSNDILPRLFPLLHQLTNTYGKKSFLWFGPKIGVIIREPELIKEILTNNFKFRKLTLHPFTSLLLPGLIDYNGQKWAKHRRIINPAFKLEKLKLKHPAFYSSCVEMFSKWNEIVPAEGIELDVWPDIKALTSDVISRVAFGSNYREGRKIFELQSELARYLVDSLTSPYIPGSRFLPTNKNKRMKAIDNEVKASLTEIINKRLMAIEAGESIDDLLGILLESNLNEIKQQGNDRSVGLSMDEIIDESKLFYLAGQETTSTFLAWTMMLLSWHQDWQQRAREEVLKVIGSDIPSFDDLPHLKVMTMTLNEILRLYSPVYGTVRTVDEETKLGEMTIPARAILLIPITELHHDPDIWGENAKEFNPERFSDGVSKATKNRLAFFPFLSGPRICIGQNMAMFEVKLTLAMLLQRFSFELSPSYAHAPLNIITVQPQYGVHLIIRKLPADR